MGILSNLVVPSWAGPAAIGLAFLAVGGYAGVQTVRLSKSKAEVETVKREKAEAISSMAEKARLATEDALNEERGRHAAQTENLNANFKVVEAQRDAAVRSGDALQRLLDRAHAAATNRDAQIANTGVAASSPAASAPVDLSGDVLRRVGEAARQLAEIADERGAAGSLCEKDYDALKATSSGP